MKLSSHVFDATQEYKVTQKTVTADHLTKHTLYTEVRADLKSHVPKQKMYNLQANTCLYEYSSDTHVCLNYFPQED